jgi:hypothetical protein
MSYRETDLVGEIQILKGIHYANPNFNAEMTAIVAALGSDTTKHSAEIEAPPVALAILQPSNANTATTHTRLTNDAILLINSAKAGGLTTSQIISAIDDTLGVAHAPANVQVPYVGCAPTPPAIGSVCTATTGQWTGSPTGYAYAWKRDGATAVGTNAATYTLVSADIGGHAITCIVTATNATGSQAAPPSNAVTT